MEEIFSQALYLPRTEHSVSAIFSDKPTSPDACETLEHLSDRSPVGFAMGSQRPMNGIGQDVDSETAPMKANVESDIG